MVKKNQTIRMIAEQYLKDPDLWQDILRANSLESAADVKPGSKLIIPVKSITGANDQLKSAKKTVAKANEAGARLFAPTVIAKALTQLQAAHTKRSAGDWKSCYELARSATAEAKKALNISLANQETSAEAVVQARKGNVQSRTERENKWYDAPLYSTLEEGEKIRTLAQSYAEIKFKDDSKLRLKENSQALIRKMRVNNLNNKTESDVTLVSGDIHAFLSGGKSSKEFKLNVPGVETNIESSNFWVNLDKKTSKFANYEGKLEIKSKGAKVLLKQNEGSIIRPNQKPSKPRKLLNAPALIAPANGDKLFSKEKQMTWEPVKGTMAYQLEIASDDKFNQVEYQRNTKRKSNPIPKNLATGVYFWRITAIDSIGLPGKFGRYRSFTIINDKIPPFLTIDPVAKVVEESTITITGETERGVTIVINEKPVTVDMDGRYRHDVALNPGLNRVMVAVNDRAGNISEKTVEIVRSGDKLKQLTIDHDQSDGEVGRIAVSGSQFVLSGSTDPGNIVTVLAITDDVVSRTTADDDGTFRFNIRNALTLHELKITTENQIGKSTARTLKIEQLATEPEIVVQTALPSLTGKETIEIAGHVKSIGSLTINGKAVSLTNQRYKTTIKLELGINRIELIGSDDLGRVTIFTKEIYLDNKPPKYLSHRFLMEPSDGDELNRLVVKVSDNSSMKRVAYYEVSSGKFNHQDYLELSQDGSSFSGIIRKPSGTGHLKLKRVILEDAFGNSKEYRF